MSNYVSKIFYNTPSFVEHCVNELARIACDKDSEHSSTTIIIKGELVQELFKLFSAYDEDGYSFDYGILNYDLDNYEKEYAILIYNDGILSIDMVYNENGEIQIFNEDVVYIHEDCNSKVKLYQEKTNNKVIPFGIGIHIEQ